MSLDVAKINEQKNRWQLPETGFVRGAKLGGGSQKAQIPVAKEISHGDAMYSMLTIVNNIVFIFESC